MKKYLLLIWLCLLPLSAIAESYVVGSVGRGEYYNSVDSQNRAWAQEGFDQRYNPVTPVYSLGMGYKQNEYISYEISYHDLGKYTQYGAWSCDDAGVVCTPTIYGYSESRTRGISLSILPKLNIVYARFGVIRYKSTWNTYYSNPSSDNTVFNNYHAYKEYGYSPVIGVGILVNNITLEVTRYSIIKPHDGSIQGVNTVSIGYIF